VLVSFNSAICNSFQNRVDFDTILKGLRGGGVCVFENPKQGGGPRYDTVAYGVSVKVPADGLHCAPG